MAESSVGDQVQHCRDFVQCRYEIRECVLKIDIFQGVSPSCLLLSITTEIG